jgi:hypothetical protein
MKIIYKLHGYVTIGRLGWTKVIHLNLYCNSSFESFHNSPFISCHGVNLEGKMGPNLQKIGAVLNKDQILKKIQNGGGVMPAFQKRLEANEIQALAEWLSLKK